MVMPWMEHGNIRQYMHRVRESGELVNQVFVNSVNKWVSDRVFLVYLVLNYVFAAV